MAAAKNGAGDNSGVDKEHEALFFAHLRKYNKALADKKAADAAMKNVGKKVLAHLGDFGLDEIKDYLKAQTPEGQEELKARHEATLRALYLAGAPVGTQIDLFEDRAPLLDRAARDGREAGMRGDALANPYNEASEEGRAYADSWHAGQEAIFAITRKIEAEESGEELVKAADAQAEPKKRGRPAKAKAGSPLDGETPDSAKAAAANQNGAPKPPKPDDEKTNAEREQERQAEAMH